MRFLEVRRRGSKERKGKEGVDKDKVGWGGVRPLASTLPLDAFSVSVSTPSASTFSAFCTKHAHGPVVIALFKACHRP